MKTTFFAAWLAPVIIVLFAHSILLFPIACVGEEFGGIDFPSGARSFADAVIRYEPLYSGGPGPTRSKNLDPLTSLGVPDYPTEDKYTEVSLGRGGLLELAFTNNVLTNSGDASGDLYIFEVGGDVEDTYVAIRPTASTIQFLDPLGDTNEDGFWEIGKVFGSTSAIDIDAVFPGFEPGELVFDAVQLIDDYFEGHPSEPTVGADIDAVGAISSVDILLQGDYNNDGIVDAADYTVWRDNLSGDNSALNGNGDETGASTGVVDQADYTAWKSNFGATNAAANANGSTVPEPSSVLLGALAALALLLRRSGQ